MRFDAKIAAQLAYTANIFILIPVLLSLYLHKGKKSLKVFQGTVANENGLRFLVGSLWFAILILSGIGLYFPILMLPVLALQVIYKFIYLFTYIFPRWIRNGYSSIPQGITIFFIIIVVLWPFILFANRNAMSL